MSDSQDKRKTYSTGELAEACGVSVRTVQYYDEKGLLPPADTSEGGRRIYTDADVAKLRKILLLKSLGLQLVAIRGVLESNASGQVLQDILQEQDRKLEAEVAKRQAARETIALMTRGLQEKGELPAESIAGMETIMQNDKTQEQQLQSLYKTLWASRFPWDSWNWERSRTGFARAIGNHSSPSSSPPFPQPSRWRGSIGSVSRICARIATRCSSPRRASGSSQRTPPPHAR